MCAVAWSLFQASDTSTHGCWKLGQVLEDFLHLTLRSEAYSRADGKGGSARPLVSGWVSRVVPLASSLGAW